MSLDAVIPSKVYLTILLGRSRRWTEKLAEGFDGQIPYSLASNRWRTGPCRVPEGYSRFRSCRRRRFFRHR